MPMPSSNTTDYKSKGAETMNNQSTLNLVPPALRSPATAGRSRVCGLCLTLLLTLTSAHADDTLFDNYGSYVNIEHQEGLDTDRVLIINHGRVFIGDVEENGYFNAYGINGSVWGSQTGVGQVIVLQNPVDGE
jgi:hypothetical protein